MLSAWALYRLLEAVWPICAASAAPSRRALCCTAVVKKEDENVSSQRSKLQIHTVIVLDVSFGGIHTLTGSSTSQHNQDPVE